MSDEKSMIQEETWLSPRETELVTKFYKEEKDIETVAEEMGIEKTTANSLRYRIMDKKSKSKQTIKILEEYEK